MTIKDAIVTLNANVVIACERAGFSSETVKIVEDALDTIEEALKEQETVVPLTIDDAVSEIMDKHYKRLKEQEWISVKDRLPNCNGCYLVWRPHFYTEKGMPSICYFDGQNTWHDSYGVDFTRMLSLKDVSHWMPLPEQPKER